jgi:hypothetical protein
LKNNSIKVEAEAKMALSKKTKGLSFMGKNPTTFSVTTTEIYRSLQLPTLEIHVSHSNDAAGHTLKITKYGAEDTVIFLDGKHLPHLLDLLRHIALAISPQRVDLDEPDKS